MKSYESQIKSYENHIRHSASCEGVFSIPVLPWQGMFSVSLRDPRTPVLITLACPFFSVFLVLFAKSLFWGFCGQHGLNMGPTWAPRGLQNQEKTIHNRHNNGKKDLIRHSASCEGVFCVIVALTGLFSVHLRDPRIPVTAGLGRPRVGPGRPRAFLF